jgi:PAS domain S-box-containing protein
MISVRALKDEAGEPMGFIAVAVDVSAAKAAEAALRESETRFRSIADIAPSPVWLTNADGEIDFANEALCALYGLSSQEMKGHVWRDRLHPDDLAEVAAIQSETRPRRLSYGFEARVRRHDGVWRWMRVAVRPRSDEYGVFLGYVGMAFDITDTREALNALAAQERRQTFLLALIDRLRDLSDPDEIMGVVESSLGDLLGAERVGYGEVDQAAGLVSMTRDWTAGVASARGQFSLRDLGGGLIDELAAGLTVRVEDVRTDPRTTDVAPAFDALQTRSLIRAPLIRNGRLRAFLYAHAARTRVWTDAEAALLEEVAARTWTEVERARAEVETRESEQRFRVIADTAPVLIWVTSPDRSRAFVNQAYVDFYGSTWATRNASFASPWPAKPRASRFPWKAATVGTTASGAG